jgi:hypothetical protein
MPNIILIVILKFTIFYRIQIITFVFRRPLDGMFCFVFARHAFFFPNLHAGLLQNRVGQGIYSPFPPNNPDVPIGNQTLKGQLFVILLPYLFENKA